MNEEDFKELIRELMAPLYDNLVNYVFNMFKHVLPQLAGQPLEQQQEQIKQAVELITKGVKNSWDNVDSQKLSEALKEVQNGR